MTHRFRFPDKDGGSATVESGVCARAPGSSRDLDYAISGSNVIDLIDRQARQHPRAPALVHGSITLTYGQLTERAAELAGCLERRIVPNEIVGLCAPRSIAFVVGALGIMRAGLAFLPLDPAYPKERLGFQIRDSGAATVVVTQRHLCQLPEAVDRLCLSIDGRLVDEKLAAAFRNSSPRSPENLAYVIYTSGSTGQPKGVEITHRNLSNLVCWHLSAFDISPTDRASHMSSVGFDASVWEVWPYLAAGASVYVADDSTKKDPLELRDWLVARRISIAFVPAPLAECMIDLDWPLHTSLRTLLTGGDVLHRFPRGDLPFRVVNNYGPTECAVVATSAVVPPRTDRKGTPPLGRPIANTSVHILDQGIRPVRPGDAGEIWISGAGVGRGYRNRPELTRKQFVPVRLAPATPVRMYRTGDRGRLLQDGQVEFLGRIDEQIKIRGHRVEPAEIEVALMRHPDLRQGAVVASQKPSGQQQLIAYLVLKKTRSISAGEFRKFLETQIPDYMIPSRFVPVSSLPTTLNGKLDRAALRRIAAQPVAPAGRHATAGDAFERALRAIWQEVLCVDTVGIHDDFFHAGGDSLAAVRLITQIEKSFGLGLPLSVLLESPTIEKMAELVRQGGQRRRHLIALRPEGTGNPIFCIHNHTGDVLYCRSFDRLPADHPVYGLQSDGTLSHRSVEAMAAHYLEEVRRVQRPGPCLLFGFSFGGLVAFEMACRLMENNKEAVAFLGMFNTPVPGSLGGWPLGQISYLRGRVRNEIGKLSTLSGRGKAVHIFRNTLNFGRMVTRSARTEIWRRRAKQVDHRVSAGVSPSDIAAINIAAAKNYAPRRIFDGPITFFKASTVPYLYSVPPELGWSQRATRGVNVVTIPDATLPLTEALAQSLCEALRVFPPRHQAS